MPIIIHEKIRIGVSACNAGARVRYNRAGWDRIAQLNREMTSFIWTPVCPEVMAGFGVPREAVRLSGGNGDDLWDDNARMKNRSGMDLTDDIKAGCGDCLEALKRADVQAFVIMEGSPSCGVYRTTLKNKRLGHPPGVFGSLLLKEDLFLIPALDLESPLKWWDWRRRLHAFCWLKGLEIDSKKQIYDVWHHLKFMCQEVDDAEARRIGSWLAGLPKRLTRQAAEEWRSATLRLLRKPSTIKRITSVMMKHYAFYRKHFHPGAEADEEAVPGEDITAPTADVSKYKYVEELLKMEKRAVTEGFDFEGAPVLYRENR
jgi:uncharacterized protein YbbK (DUF523 family)